MTARAAAAAKHDHASEILLREDIGGIAVLTLNHPQSLNCAFGGHAGGAGGRAHYDRPR